MHVAHKKTGSLETYIISRFMFYLCTYVQPLTVNLHMRGGLCAMIRKNEIT